MAFGLMGYEQIPNGMQNAGMAGFNQGLQGIGQGLANTQANLQNQITGTQLQYMPQMQQSLIAMNQAKAGLYQGEGQDQAAKGKYYSAQANNITNGFNNPAGQAQLQYQAIVNNPNSTPQQISAARAYLGLESTGINTSTPGGQAYADANASTQFPAGSSSPFTQSGISLPGFAALAFKQPQSEVQLNQAEAAAEAQKAQLTNQEAINQGANVSSTVTPGMPTSAPAQPAVGYGGQPGSFPTQQNFTLWPQGKQDEYIANNNTMPPLPPGTPILSGSEVDHKTLIKTNGLPEYASSMQQIMPLLDNPQVTQYMGKQAVPLIKQAIAEYHKVGTYPPGYADYLNFEKQLGIATESVAGTLTGSSSIKAILNMQDQISSHDAIDPEQAKQMLQNLNIDVYNQAKDLSGQPLPPALRNEAFQAAKQLQPMATYNIGGKVWPMADVRSAAQQAGESPEQFVSTINGRSSTSTQR